MEKQYPLILVFYLDAELMKNKDIIQPFAASVNDAIAARKANAIAFFLPTKGEERLECINPIMVKEAEMEEINKLVNDIKKAFDVNPEITVPVEEITLEPTCGPECECGGDCKCNTND